MPNLKAKNKIKELRLKRGLSQSELAKLVGVTKWMIIALEQGESGPSERTAEAISKVFKAPVNEIFYI